MFSEYEESVREYWSIGNGKYIIKLAQDESKEESDNKANVTPLHLGAFVLSNSKRIMKNFVGAMTVFQTNDIYYTDIDLLYIENEHWKKI